MKHTNLKGISIFNIFNIIGFIVIALIALIPWLHVLAKSASGAAAVMSGRVSLLPVDIQFEAYQFVIWNSGYLRAFSISLFVTTVGTLLSLVFTTMAAYPLSKPGFKGRKFFLLLYIFAMLFYGGVIPNYMLIKGLGLINSVWSLLIPYLIVPFHLFIMKTFFETIPDSMEESAKIDGAGNMTILLKIVLPVSLPVMATVGLLNAVIYWNDYIHPLFYISRPELKPLQLFMYDMITSIQAILKEGDADQFINMPTEGVQAATIVLTALPIIIVYPFLQKYFVKGLTIGSVKG
jgi:putative aldouronate transport system permease protein